MEKNMITREVQEELYANIIVFLGKKINKEFRYAINFNPEFNCNDLSFFFNEVEDASNSSEILKDARDSGIMPIQSIMSSKKDGKIIKIRIDQEKFLEIQNQDVA